MWVDVDHRHHESLKTKRWCQICENFIKAVDQKGFRGPHTLFRL